MYVNLICNREMTLYGVEVVGNGKVYSETEIKYSKDIATKMRMEIEKRIEEEVRSPMEF